MLRRADFCGVLSARDSVFSFSRSPGWYIRLGARRLCILIAASIGNEAVVSRGVARSLHDTEAARMLTCRGARGQVPNGARRVAS